MRKIILLCLSLFFLSNALANDTFIQRKEVQEFINKMAKEYSFNKQKLSQTMQDVKIQTRVLESMERPSEQKPWDVYKQLFLTPERLKEGLAFWKTNQQILEKAEKQYGVPAHIIVAVLGVETFYGRNQGQYRVIDALSTLAFNYPKRSNYFLKELQEFFLLCRDHAVNPTEYLGSYAGAMGKPQFMPSSYRYYAADFSNKKKKDLMNDNNAVIASIANYLSRHGWKTHGAIAKPASTKEHLDNTNTSYAESHLKSSFAENKISSQASLNTSINKAAKVVKFTTQNGTLEYWFVYPNFKVITRYNSSPQYAMAVFLLAQQLKREWQMFNTNIG